MIIPFCSHTRQKPRGICKRIVLTDPFFESRKRTHFIVG
jgi:hypothetical protein